MAGGRDDWLCALKSEHSQVRDEMTKTMSQLSEVTSVLDELQKLIYSAFERVGCSRKVLEDMLGLNVPINTNNMIVYLGIIEQRANELLNILHYVNLKVSRSLSLSLSLYNNNNNSNSYNRPNMPGMWLTRVCLW